MQTMYLDFHAPRDDRDFRSGLIRSAGGNPKFVILGLPVQAEAGSDPRRDAQG